MRFDPGTVVETLQRLEQQGGLFRPHAAEIAVALNKGEFEQALEANGRLQTVLESIVTIKTRLREHVVPADGLGEPGESLGELAIRARGMVILMQVGRLREALRDGVALVRSREWFIGRFQRIDEVATFFRDELRRINGIWKPYRQDQPVLAGVSDMDRVTMYRTTVRIAQRALRELADELDIARLLEKGAAAADLPDVHVACKQIQTVLSLQIDVEPSRQLEPRRPWAGAASSAAGSQ